MCHPSRLPADRAAGVGLLLLPPVLSTRLALARAARFRHDFLDAGEGINALVLQEGGVISAKALQSAWERTV